MHTHGWVGGLSWLDHSEAHRLQTALDLAKNIQLRKRRSLESLLNSDTFTGLKSSVAYTLASESTKIRGDVAPTRIRTGPPRPTLNVL